MRRGGVGPESRRSGGSCLKAGFPNALKLPLQREDISESWERELSECE